MPAGRDATYQIDADQIDAFLRALRKHADAKSLNRELREGLKKGAEPLMRGVQEAIPEALPHGGGLGALIQSEAKFTAVARTGRYAGLWVRATAKSSSSKKNRDLRGLLAQGQWRHPLFGNKSHWYVQAEGANPERIRAAIQEQAGPLKTAALEVMEGIARKIVNDGGL